MWLSTKSCGDVQIASLVNIHSGMEGAGRDGIPASAGREWLCLSSRVLPNLSR